MRRRHNEAAYEEKLSSESYSPYEEEAYPSPYEGEEEGYPTEAYPDEWESPPLSGPEVVSTSQAINLTCTLAAVSSLFALFLYFNDERSRAVRRLSVQSMGLGAVYLAVGLGLLALGAVFGVIPLIGVIMGMIFWVCFMGVSLVVVFLKVQMMKHAYRGYAYQLPAIGRWLRRFE